MASKKIITAFLLLQIGFSQEINLNNDSKDPVLSPILKSLIFPGWGEYALGNKKRGKVFAVTESFIIISILGSYSKANTFKSNYEAYAAQHAGVSILGKNRQYWVDIGNYLSIDQFNEEHLRWRDYNALYQQNDNWSWHWDNDENRKSFEKMRIKADTWKLRGSFLIGGMVLNHIVSAIDSLYLFRISKIKDTNIIPSYSSYMDHYNLSLNFYF
tara:strand:+ start:18 stop:659 length:642 start_codon:yes stop_codon:yes gene_type:complete